MAVQPPLAASHGVGAAQRSPLAATPVASGSSTVAPEDYVSGIAAVYAALHMAAKPLLS